MKKLPKLYRSVIIKFWSLRAGLGDGYGVVFDVDTQVERLAKRVRSEDGWKWQLVNFDSIYEYDQMFEEDQLCLDEQGMDVSDITILESFSKPNYFS